MKIACIGGGPASLYFALLLKQRLPEVEIDIYEQNRADDTFGWGVVFSDETLGNFEVVIPEYLIGEGGVLHPVRRSSKVTD